MTKLLPFICTVLSFVVNVSASETTSITTKPEEQTTWRDNFKQLHNEQWDGYKETQERWKYLGYDPQITLLEKNDYSVTQQSGPTLFIHGWNSSKDAYSVTQLCNSNNIPGDVVTFNFQDASYWWNQTVPYQLQIGKSSFAGPPDVDALLCVLKTLHSLNCLPAVWYPHSRGSGTVLKVIGMLNQPNETQELMLETSWNIDVNVRRDILNSIKIIYLLNPLTNVDFAINKQVEKRLWIFRYLLPAIIKKGIASGIKNKLLPRLTQYDPTQSNPIDYVAQWKDVAFKVWLHFEENDWDVSNEDDKNLTQQLLGALKINNFYVSCTNNGGHNAYPTFINQIIHGFNSSAHCSCNEIDSFENIRIAAEITSNARPNKSKINSYSCSCFSDKNKKFCDCSEVELKVKAQQCALNNITKHLHDFSQKYTEKTFWNHRITKGLITMFKISCSVLLLYYLNQGPHGICGYHFAIPN